MLILASNFHETRMKNSIIILIHKFELIITVKLIKLLTGLFWEATDLWGTKFEKNYYLIYTLEILQLLEKKTQIHFDNI